MTAPETIYLDHNATTPTRAEVVEAMAECYRQGYANPASQHRPGQQARKVIHDARERIAELLGADLTSPQPDRLVFTATGTEANNLAILGIAAADGNGPGHLIISSIEHPCVIQPAEDLLEQGWDLDTISVDGNGVVNVEQLRGLINDKTRVVSVMLGNHETGVLQPVAECAEICNAAGVPLHTDAVQVAGKLPVDFRGLGAAAMSVAAHKFQGPVGIGALILRHGVAIAPITFGGHQQYGLRPGTESVALTVGMLTALELWQKEAEEHRRHLTAMREQFENGIRAGFPDAIVHSEDAERLPQTANIAFQGVDAQMLLMALDQTGVACSVGSACSSGSTELSPTLKAMGLPLDVVKSSLRFSVGATNTEAEIAEAVRRILYVVDELSGLGK